MDNGLTRDQMIHFVACNVLLGKEAFSYLLSRIYFISVSFGCVQVSSFFQAFWNVNVALVGSRLPTFRDNLSIPSASVQHRVRLQKSEGSSCYICAGVAQLVQPLVYGLDLRGFALQQEKKKRIFSSPKRSEEFWGPPTWGYFPGVKRSGREANHSV